MPTLAKEWQTDPNHCWYTEEILYCHICNKRSSVVIELKVVDTVRVCWNCLKDTFSRLFQENEFVYGRLLQTHITNPKKSREPIGLSLRYSVLERDHFRCVTCGRRAGDCQIEIDHIVPVSAGGKTTKSNLRTLCFDCNRGKSDG